MKRLLFVFSILVVSSVASSPLFAQANPFVGTWKLNVARSKFEGVPTPKSLTRTVVVDGKGAKYTFEGVAADGAPISYGFSTNYDGKDNPVTGKGMPGGADSVSLGKISGNKSSGILKKGGKEIGKSEVEVSKDGKVTTVKSKVTLPDGKESHSETVYDKQ